MRLKIKSKPKEGSALVVSMPMIYIGTKHIDEIRNFCNCNLLLDRIDERVAERSYREITLVIEEKDARNLGICEKCGIEEISVNEQELNPLFELRTNITKYEDTGEIQSAWMMWELNYEKAIEFIRENMN